ncbi:MAG: hypothetical protein R3C10_19680 [Pirellulales bacterium]
MAGERIDIVRWSDDPQVMIPNSLQPAEVEEVILCQMLGRAIVLVREDQLSLAIGRRGQNVRLGSRLSGWDIEIMTADELNEQIEGAVMGFAALEGMNEELADKLVGEGFLTYDDLSIIEPDALMEMGGLTAAEVDAIVSQAEDKAERAEEIAKEQRRLRRERERLEAEVAEAAAAQGVSLRDPSAEAVASDDAMAELAAEQTASDGTTETGIAETGTAEAGTDVDGVPADTGVAAESVTQEREAGSPESVSPAAEADGGASEAADDGAADEEAANQLETDKDTETTSSS